MSECTGDGSVSFQFNIPLSRLVGGNLLPGAGDTHGIASRLSNIGAGVGEGVVDQVDRFGKLHSGESPNRVLANAFGNTGSHQDVAKFRNSRGATNREFGDGLGANPVFLGEEKVGHVLDIELIPVKVGWRMVSNAFPGDTMNRSV